MDYVINCPLVYPAIGLQVSLIFEVHLLSSVSTLVGFDTSTVFQSIAFCKSVLSDIP